MHHCLWPTTPTRLAFHYELLDRMEALLLDSQVAATDFSTALVAHLSFLYQKEVGVIQLQDMYIIFVKVHTKLGYVCYDCMHCCKYIKYLFLSVVAVAMAISVHVYLISLFLFFQVSTKVYTSIIDSFVEYRLAMIYLPLSVCAFSPSYILSEISWLLIIR